MEIAIGALVVAIVGIVVYSIQGRSGTWSTSGIGGANLGDSMMVVISIVVLAASLYVILIQGYPDATQKWAFGAVGTIIGFWLKTTKTT